MENIILNDYYSLDFLGKNCKNNCHNICAGQWKGFGFKVDCNCECHDKKKVLGRSVIDHDISTENSVITKLGVIR